MNAPPPRFAARLPALWGLMLCLAAGCAGVLHNASNVPDRKALIIDQLVIHSDFDLTNHDPLLADLAQQRHELLATLALPASKEAVHVYLFPTDEQFRRFMRARFPQLPERRAFFVKSDGVLTVYAHWGDRVAEDLRHEVAHGYLHSVVPNIPLWLDEGLAEYFEVARGQQGLNAPHLEELSSRLMQGNWRPDLARLERLEEVDQMSQLDYAESWAWVHFLLEPEQRGILQGYLRDLRRDGGAEPLAAQLRRHVAQPEQELVGHLLACQAQRRTSGSAAGG